MSEPEALVFVYNRDLIGEDLSLGAWALAKFTSEHCLIDARGLNDGEGPAKLLAVPLQRCVEMGIVTNSEELTDEAAAKALDILREIAIDPTLN